MWSYSGKGLFFIGIFFSLVVFLAFTALSVAESALCDFRAALSALFPGRLIVSAGAGPSPQQLLSGEATSVPAGIPEAAAIEKLIEGLPGTEAVLPLSAAWVRLRSDLPELTALGKAFAIGISPEDLTAYGADLSIEPDNPAPDGKTFFFITDASIDPAFESERTFFLDSTGAPDNLNLTAAVVSGKFSLSGADGSALRLSTCLVDPATLFRASWRARGDFFPAQTPAPLSGSDSEPKVPRFYPLPATTPLTYPYLFSLPTAGKGGVAAKAAPAPQYLLVGFSASVNPAEYVSTVNVLLEEKGSPVRARVWNPSDPAATTPARFYAIPAAAALCLLVIILLANLVLVPSPSALLLDLLEKGAPARARRSAVFKKNLFLSLVFGCIGLVSALLFILFFNLFSGRAEKEFLSSLCGLPVTLLWPSPQAFIFAAFSLIAFTCAAVPGPYRRLRRLLRRPEPEREKPRGRR